MLHLLQMGPSKVLTTFLVPIQSSWQFSLLKLPPLCRNTVTPSSDSSKMYTSTVQSSPPLLMLHSRPTLVSKLLILHLPILYLLPLLLAFLPRLLPPLPPLTLSGFFNGMLEVFEPGALNYFHFLSSHPVDLIYIQEGRRESFMQQINVKSKVLISPMLMLLTPKCLNYEFSS